MTRRIATIGLFLITSLVIAQSQGCVAIYCTIKYWETPESQDIEMFVWETEKFGTPSGQPRDTLGMIRADVPDHWVLFDNDERDWLRTGFHTKQILIDNNGNYLDTLPHRQMRDVESVITFTRDWHAFNNLNLTIEIEEDTYPQYLEVEAWLRQTLGRLVAPFMGKSGRAFIVDYHSKFVCGHPRLAVTVLRSDGSTVTRRFTLPKEENESWQLAGALLSSDEQFLYIYSRQQGAIMRVDSLLRD